MRRVVACRPCHQRKAVGGRFNLHPALAPPSSQLLGSESRVLSSASILPRSNLLSRGKRIGETYVAGNYNSRLELKAAFNRKAVTLN